MDLFLISSLTCEPIIKVNEWLQEAIQMDIALPHAMNLATVDSNNQPSSRMVLLKAISDRGLIFYTDYSSRKGNEIENNAKAALNFWWVQMNKQIRMEGTCYKTAPEESDSYFNSRPRGAQISTQISNQSQTLESYDSLAKQFEIFEKNNLGKEIVRPARWGGYVLEPSRIEFWVEKSNRLHLRELFSLSSNGWNKAILSP